MYLMLVLVLALEPPRSLRRLTLLRLLLLEPIVLQSQRTEKANPPLQLPAAAVLADAQHCYSKFFTAAAAPITADVAAEPVCPAPPTAMSPPPASANATQRRLHSRQ